MAAGGEDEDEIRSTRKPKVDNRNFVADSAEPKLIQTLALPPPPPYSHLVANPHPRRSKYCEFHVSGQLFDC